MTITNELLKCELNYVLDDNNNPWFSGKGVGVALGYKNTNNAIKDHVDDDDKNNDNDDDDGANYEDDNDNR